MLSTKQNKNALEVLFDSKLRLKLLKLLFRNSTASFTLKELAARVQEKNAVVKKEVKKLKEIGLLRIKR